MANSNFKTFNEAYINLESDLNYSADLQRQNGLTPGMARTTMHNKLFRQTSVMADALARYMVSEGYDALDTDVDLLAGNFKLALLHSMAAATIIPKNMWRPEDNVTSGDIRFTKDGNGPSWAYLLCQTTGTTGASEPVLPANAVIGQTIIDGSATWSVQDARNALTLGRKAASWYAPINSPAFEGSPTAPTPAASDNSTKLATTAFVKTQLENIPDMLTGFVQGFGQITDLGERNGTYIAADDGFLAVTFPGGNSGRLTIVSGSTITLGIPTEGGIYPVPKSASWHVQSSTGGIDNHCYWIPIRRN